MQLAESDEMSVDLKSIRETTPYGGAASPARVIVERDGDDIVRLTFVSQGNDYEILSDMDGFEGKSSNNSQLDVEISETEEYGFNVTVFRSGNKDNSVFNTILGPLIMGEDYIELTSTLPSKYVRGMGLRGSGSPMPDFDQYESWLMDSKESRNLSTALPGTHPFYLGLEPNLESAYGVYMQSSMPMRVSTVSAPGFSYKGLLGVFRIVIFAGPTPSDVSRQYTSIVGRPQLPPYWALGFHMCRTLPRADEAATFRYCCM